MFPEEIDVAVEADTPIPEAARAELPGAKLQIGKHCAALVDNGATLQVRIGAIPDAVLRALGDPKDLGIHTEMFSDGVVDRVETGILNGSNKATHPGKIVSIFAMGTRLYDFMDDNLLLRITARRYGKQPTTGSTSSRRPEGQQN